MLASITVPAGSPTGVTGTHTYQYDVLGRRVRKTVTGTTPSDTVYIHLGQRVYAEYPATVSWSNPSRFYAYGSYVDEPIALIKFAAPGAGQMERFYYHRNQQYSITALTSQAGAVVERYAYTAYGEPTILDAAGTTTRTSSAYGNPYLYTARAYDSESGLYYFRARMYEGRKGRFLGHDPIEYPDGANTYAGWFSVVSVDPFGRCKSNATASEDPNGPGVCLLNTKINGEWKLVGVIPTNLGPGTIAPGVGSVVKRIRKYSCMYEREEIGCYDCQPCCFAQNKAAKARKDGKGYGSVEIDSEETAWVGLGVSIGAGDFIGGVGGDVINILDEQLQLGLSADYFKFQDTEDEKYAKNKCPRFPNPKKKDPDKTTTVGLPNSLRCKKP